jgi:hypothetical protein
MDVAATSTARLGNATVIRTGVADVLANLRVVAEAMTRARFKRTLKWQPGDVFVVPLADGSFGHVQAVAAVMKHAIDFVIFSTRSPEAQRLPVDLGPASVIAIGATWRTSVTGGYWGKVGCFDMCMEPAQCPNQVLIEKNNSIGVRHASIDLFEDFISACHGLIPWNIHAAHQFDEYLVPGKKRPSMAYELSAADLALYQKASGTERDAQLM